MGYLLAVRIGIDLRLNAYAPGGITAYACRLALELPRLLRPDLLFLFPHRRDTQDFSIPGTQLHPLWTPPHHRWERWFLGAEVAPLRLHVFHSTDFIPIAWGASRKIITVHDLNFLYYPQYLTPSARHYYNDQIEWAVAHADAVIADSYATQDDLIRLLHVPASKITTIHLAASEEYRPLSQAAVAAVLARYGLAPGYLLFVGTWEPRKNLPGLLEAFALLQASGQKQVLVIAGRPGWLYDEIFTRVRELRLEDSVRFLERPTTEELIALYNGARLLVLPSFYEGFGLPVLEAMQCGTPVVVSDRASLPEVVGEAGLCVDPEDPAAIADACQRLIADPELHARLQVAGLARARRFTWQATAQATLALYRSVAP